MSVERRRLARAIHDHGQAKADGKRETYRAEVKSANPLTLDVVGAARTLDEDDIDFSQWALLYDQTYGIAKGDTVTLHRVDNEWLLVDVLSDNDLPPLAKGSDLAPYATTSDVAAATATVIREGDARLTDARTASSIPSAVLTAGVHIAAAYASRPTATAALNGVRFFATDKLMEWQVIAGAWALIAASAPNATSLPASPVDRQEVHFQTQAMATAGFGPWHLRYRTNNPDGSTNANTSKWEPVGVPTPLFAEAHARVTKVSMPAATFGSVDANDPTVTVPLAGDYLVRHAAAMVPANAAAVAIGVKVGATEPVVNTNTVLASAVAGGSAAMSQEIRALAVPAATVLAQRYYQNQLAQNVDRMAASLSVVPLRVG